jgi:hypothetical protein
LHHGVGKHRIARPENFIPPATMRTDHDKILSLRERKARGIDRADPLAAIRGCDDYV